MLNRIVLGLNLVTLFVIVGERSNVNAGSLSWLGSLPWSSFATEAWALTTEPTVSSDAILAAWLFITGLWVLTTVSTWMLGRRKAVQHALPESTSLGPNATHANSPASNGQRIDPAIAQGSPHDSSNPSGAASSTAKSHKPTNDIPDPALGSLFDDLSRQVDAFTPEARAELAKVKNALTALAQKDSGPPNA
jgi:hypothetical protein